MWGSVNQARPGLLVVLIMVLAGLPASAAADTGLTGYGSVIPAPAARTIPYFSDSFTFGGDTFPYTMVGSNPRTTRATSIVPTVIVPLRLVFADGNVSEPGAAVSKVLASPLFQSASFATGATQYGDAVRRAMFWQYLTGTDYHVLLSQPPVVLPTQTLQVPPAQGVYLPAGAASGPPALGLHVAAPTGIVSTTWFGDTHIRGAFAMLVNSLELDPTTVVIFVSRNVVLSSTPIPFGNPILGFHTTSVSINGNGAQEVQTAIWADYADPYSVVELPGITRNTDVLSHEVSEWLHDPFLSNVVPGWRSPLPLSSFFYGCSHFLETGDPLSEVGFEVNGYQLQDEAFFSWFAKQVPSIGINGQYTLLGTFNQPSPVC